MNEVLEKLSSIIDEKTKRKEAAKLLRELCINTTENDLRTINQYIIKNLNETVRAGYNINDEYHTLSVKKLMDIFFLLKTCYFLKKKSLRGFSKRLKKLIKYDYISLKSALYEFQIAEILERFGCNVMFIDEGGNKSPDLFASFSGKDCEIECKSKMTVTDTKKYLKSIYESTQTARKQFTKKYPGVLMIEIDSLCFENFLRDFEELEEKVGRALRTSTTISVIILTTKRLQDNFDYLVYSNSFMLRENEKVRYKTPEWLFDVFPTKKD